MPQFDFYSFFFRHFGCWFCFCFFIFLFYIIIYLILLFL